MPISIPFFLVEVRKHRNVSSQVVSLSFVNHFDRKQVNIRIF